MDSKITTYFPDRPVRMGYASLLKEMFSEVVDSRWLTFQLFKRNFFASYRQSMLGLFWALVAPLVTVATFIFLNSSGIFNVGDTKVPYPLFALAGTALWQFFSVGLTMGSNALVNAGGMLKKIYFPRESLVFSTVAQGIVPPLIQTVLVFIFFLRYEIVPPITILLVPLAVIPLLLLTTGVAFLVSVINAVVRDVGTAIAGLATFLMFLTPVLYAKPPSGLAATVSQYNPLYYLLAVPRDLFLFGSTDNLRGYLYSIPLCIVVFLACWIAFRLSGTRVVERI